MIPDFPHDITLSATRELKYLPKKEHLATLNTNKCKKKDFSSTGTMSCGLKRPQNRKFNPPNANG
jgi:hypothetical protein